MYLKDELLKAKEKAEQNEYRFLQVSEVAGELIWEVDPNGLYIYVSPLIESLLGYRPDEVVGKKYFYDLFIPEKKEELKQAAFDFISKQESFKNFENILTHKNGDLLYVNTSARPFFDGDGNFMGYRGVDTDITERKHTEEALKISKERLQVATEGAGIGIWNWNIETGELYWSDKSKELFGLDHDVTMSYERFIDGLHPDDQEKTDQAVKDALENHKDIDLDYRTRWPDGSIHWVRAKGRCFYADNGNAVRLEGILIDISEQKRTEEDLKLQSTIASNMAEGVNLVRSSDGVIVYTNPTFERMFGYEPGELIGKHVSEINAPTDKSPEEIANEIIQSLSEKGSWRGEVYNIKKNGSKFWCWATVSSFNHHEYGSIWISVHHDITGRKQAEHDLLVSKTKIEESEEKYRSIFEKGLVAILIADDQGSYISANKAAGILFGYSPEELLKMKPGDLQTVNDPSAEERYQLYIQKGEESGEFEFISKTGEHKIAFYHAIRLKENYNLSMLVDITEQKKAEKDLLDAKVQAEEANKAKSQFLAKMSHELRTPLNGVIGFTELLSGTSLTPVQKEYVNSANISGHNLLRIINDILDMSKIEAGILELDPVLTDIHQLIQNSVDIVKLSAAQKKLELLLDLDPKLPRHVILDSVRLTQILSNLIGNAIKFTEDGEVELKVEYHSLTKGTGRIHFSVRDSGIGITEGQKQHLFKAFSQADASTTRRFGGTGLGLVISQKIAEKMGGQIDYESIPGVGSRFFFELEVQADQGLPSMKMDLPQKRCLLVDDHSGSRAILTAMLSRRGVETVECMNGLEAIKVFESDPKGFDILICDEQMPGMDGQKTVQLILEKVDGAVKKLHVIMLSMAGLDSGDICDPAGIFCRIEKPVNADRLFDCISRIHYPDSEVEKELVDPVSHLPKELPLKWHQTVTILIAEDVSLNMNLICALLNTLIPKAELIRAEDGEQAIQICRNRKPDLILMDVQMPKMDGLEATRAIRELERITGDYTPIVALTAAAMQEDRENCLTSGMDEVITKPIEPDKLRKVLATWIPNKEIDLNS